VLRCGVGQDVNGNVLTEKDALGNLTTHAYDSQHYVRRLPLLCGLAARYGTGGHQGVCSACSVLATGVVRRRVSAPSHIPHRRADSSLAAILRIERERHGL
jgi:hypothetical protein